MSTLKIALVQMNCSKSEIEHNLATTEQYIKESLAKKIDIICFPEMSITGYINPTKSPDAMLTLKDDAVQRFCAMTKNSTITAIAGIVEKNLNGKPFITQIVASQGNLQGYYRKVNVAEDEVKWFASATETPIFKHGNIPFGVAICADVGHGELFETYAQRGARIVFAAAAPGLYGSQETRDWQSGFDWWRGECERNLSKFAGESHIYIAVATQSGRTVDEDFPGGGYAFNSSGERIAGTPDWSEGVLYAEVDA
jgi:predicted amidohydrolase